MTAALLLVLTAASVSAPPPPSGGARAIAVAQAEIVPAVRISSRSAVSPQPAREPRRQLRRLADGRAMIEFE